LMRLSLLPNLQKIKRMLKNKLLKMPTRLSSNIKWSLPHTLVNTLKATPIKTNQWSRLKNIIMLKLNKILTLSQRNQIIKMNNCKTKLMPPTTPRPLPTLSPKKPQLLLMLTARRRTTNNNPAQSSRRPLRKWKNCRRKLNKLTRKLNKRKRKWKERRTLPRPWAWT
jgi:hypothetical protein